MFIKEHGIRIKVGSVKKMESGRNKGKKCDKRKKRKEIENNKCDG